MSRTIQMALQANLDQTVSTTTRLLRLQLRNGLAFGAAQLDRDVPYDHGDAFGAIAYSATNGFDQSTISSDVSYQVANSEARALVAAPGMGITVEMVESGQLDDAEWTLFLVDYENPVTGSAAILDAGDVGEVSVENGMVYIPQLNSYSMRLSQPVGTVWQRPCRAVAGTPRNSPTGCGWDVSGLWTNFTVISVGAESDRVFDVSETDATGFGWFPGRLTWATGDNASDRLYVVESAVAITGGTRITLADTTPYEIQVGDTGPIRPDCPKNPTACMARANYINYNGEDAIPSGDAMAGTWPGAQLPGGGGWTGEVPNNE